MERQLTLEEIESALEKRVFFLETVSTNEKDIYINMNGATYRIQYDSIHLLT